MKEAVYKLPTCDACGRILHAKLPLHIDQVSASLKAKGKRMRATVEVSTVKASYLFCACVTCTDIFEPQYDDAGRILKGKKIGQ